MTCKSVAVMLSVVALAQCGHYLLILPFPLSPQYDYRKDRERRDDYRSRDRDYDRGLYVVC